MHATITVSSHARRKKADFGSHSNGMRTLLLVLTMSSLAFAVFVSPSWADQPNVRAPVGTTKSDPVPRISLITMGKGEVVWQKFGHGALCVEYEPSSGRQNRCYNYGTTDFTKPVSVGWGFLRGQGEFWVSITTPNTMLRRYKAMDRSVWRQVLPLKPDKARVLAEKLAINALPENRSYVYHHFHDNCTTRVRDLVDDAFDGALRVGTDKPVGPTFREYARQGFAQDKWLLVITDFVLGRDADIQPTLWQAMFLPRFLRDQVQHALGVEPVLLYERRGPPLKEGNGSGRGWTVLLALFMAVPLGLSMWRGRYRRAGLACAVIPLFAIALFIWFLAIVTAVKEFRYNETLMLFLPTDLALLFLAPVRRVRYARIRLTMVVLASFLLAIGVFTQPLWTPILVAFLPLSLLALPDGVLGPHAVADSESADESGDKPTVSGTKSTAGRHRQGRSKRKKKGKRKQ